MKTMTHSKALPKWRSGDNVRRVINWVWLNAPNISAQVNELQPGDGVRFSDEITNLTSTVPINSCSTVEIEQGELLLDKLFSLLKPEVEKKIELRYRSYEYRKQKRKALITGVSPITEKVSDRTWVAENQVSELLEFLYSRLSDLKTRRKFYRGDPEEVYPAFFKEIFRLRQRILDEAIPPEQLQEDFTNVLKSHLQIDGWRKLKSLYRTDAHAQKRKLSTIKLDDEAKKVLTKIKADNGLNTLSEAVHFLYKRYKQVY